MEWQTCSFAKPSSTSHTSCQDDSAMASYSAREALMNIFEALLKIGKSLSKISIHRLVFFLIRDGRCVVYLGAGTDTYFLAEQLGGLVEAEKAPNTFACSGVRWAAQGPRPTWLHLTPAALLFWLKIGPPDLHVNLRFTPVCSEATTIVSDVSPATCGSQFNTGTNKADREILFELGWKCVRVYLRDHTLFAHLCLHQEYTHAHLPWRQESSGPLGTANIKQSKFIVYELIRPLKPQICSVFFRSCQHVSFRCGWRYGGEECNTKSQKWGAFFTSCFDEYSSESFPKSHFLLMWLQGVSLSMLWFPVNTDQIPKDDEGYSLLETLQTGDHKVVRGGQRSPK